MIYIVYIYIYIYKLTASTEILINFCYQIVLVSNLTNSDYFSVLHNFNEGPYVAAMKYLWL